MKQRITLSENDPHRIIRVVAYLEKTGSDLLADEDAESEFKRI